MIRLCLFRLPILLLLRVLMTKAFNSAVRLLSRREHSIKELDDKLKRKGFSSQDIEQALHSCQELGLQCDQRFTEHFIRARIRQGYGPVKIRQELKTKGVNNDLIHNELQHEQDNWLSYALDLWQKKCSDQSELSFPDLQKKQRFLLYRGFNTDTIAAVVKRLGRITKP